MAVFVAGMPCGLCGKPITRDEEVVLFPPFMPNRRDPLHTFSDGVFHRRCLEEDPSSGRVALLVEQFVSATRPGNRTCAVCGQPITWPDDHFSTGVLTSDPVDPLSTFNLMQFHRAHLDQWNRYREFRRLVTDLQTSDRWEGPRLVFDDDDPAKIRWTR